MTEVVTGAGSVPAVPAHIIPAALPHPNLSSPLARGLSYFHHFEVLLVSDGQRLWDAATAEGKQLLADVKGEKAAHDDVVAAAKAAPALDPAAQTGADVDPTKPTA
jgi:hypothetical protein